MVVAENPELLALGSRLHDLQLAYDAAGRAEDEAYERAAELCPPLPEELIYVRREGGPAHYALTEDELDLAGRPTWREFVKDGEGVYEPARRLYRADLMREWLSQADGRTVAARRMKRRLRLAEAYEAAREHAVEIACLREAIEHREDAARLVRDVCLKISNTEARTLKGVVIKAASLTTLVMSHRKDEALWRHWCEYTAGRIGVDLAKAALDVMGSR